MIKEKKEFLREDQIELNRDIKRKNSKNGYLERDKDVKNQKEQERTKIMKKERTCLSLQAKRMNYYGRTELSRMEV